MNSLKLDTMKLLHFEKAWRQQQSTTEQQQTGKVIPWPGPRPRTNERNQPSGRARIENPKF